MVKRFKKQIILIVLIICTAIGGILWYFNTPLITHIKEPIQFTNVYNPNATLLIPAAYTNTDGSIEGEYRIDGVTYGTPVRKERISISPNKGLIISGKWHSDYGFQQTVLIKNGNIRHHKDDRRRFRRALCNETPDTYSLMIVESSRPCTLDEFSKELSKLCWNAVNLDTGEYGYGWYKNKKFSSLMKFAKRKQTNWICID